MDEKMQGYWDSIVDAVDPVQYGDALEAIKGVLTKPNDTDALTAEVERLRADNDTLRNEIRTRWKNLTEGGSNETVTNYTEPSGNGSGEESTPLDLDLSELEQRFDGSDE